MVTSIQNGVDLWIDAAGYHAYAQGVIISRKCPKVFCHAVSETFGFKVSFDKFSQTTVPQSTGGQLQPCHV